MESDHLHGPHLGEHRLVLGAVALAATGVGAAAAVGLIAETTLSAGASIALGLIAAAAGTGAVLLDAGPCPAGDHAACAGVAMGTAGIIYGGFGLAADIAAYAAGEYTFTTAGVSLAGAFGGFLFGGFGLAIDSLGAAGGATNCG